MRETASTHACEVQPPCWSLCCGSTCLPSPSPSRSISGVQLPRILLLWLQPGSALRCGSGEKPSGSSLIGYLWRKHGVSQDTYSGVSSHSGAPKSGRLTFLWGLHRTSRCVLCDYLLKIILSSQNTFFSPLLTAKEVKERMTNKDT